MLKQLSLTFSYKWESKSTFLLSAVDIRANKRGGLNTLLYSKSRPNRLLKEQRNFLLKEMKINSLNKVIAHVYCFVFCETGGGR